MDGLLFLSNEIRDSLGDQVKNTGKFEINMEEKFGQEAMKETAPPRLQEDLKKTQEKADEMIRDVKRTETKVSARIAHLEETLANMQNQLNETQSDVRDLRNMKADLHTGQTAYEFENYLCTYIYPPGTIATHDQKFTRLMKWLKENKETPEGREGNIKWKELTDKYGWTDATHIPVFFQMLRCTTPHAHPTVDFSVPLISENFNTSEKKKYVEDIRMMTAELCTHVV